jgi:ubiquinone/menaquinone biosynthesis C-methylase UbiE
MSELSQEELKLTARAYDDLLAPALFQGWADRMAELASLWDDDDVLDVACGTGVLSIAANRQAGSVTGLDLNPGMLAVASERAPDVKWRRGNAESLPFEDESFDVVMSQFGLMLFDSPETAVREMWRVLRPGGRLYVAVFDALDQLPAYRTAADVYEQVVGPNIGNALRFPFSMGGVDELTALFRRAGVSDPVVTTHASEAHFENARHMVLSDVKGWFPFAGFYLDDETIDEVETKLAAALDEFVRPNGEVHFDVSVHVVQASKSSIMD